MSGLPYSIGRLTRKGTNGAYWSYCIKWWEGGQRRRISLGTTDRVAADAIARKLWGERVGVSGDTVGVIVAAYLDSLGTTRDVKRKREAWKAAEPYWGALRPSLVDLKVSLDYPAWRKRSTNTCRMELSTVRCAMNWATKTVPPVLDKAPPIVVPAIPPSSVGHLTKPQFRKFLGGCGSNHVRLFAMLAVSTGGRKAAILQAKWDQVSWNMGQIDLNPAGRNQNSKGRALVPLGERIMQALRLAKDAAISDYIIEHHGRPLLDIKKGIMAASVRSGIKVHPHMFRHSAAVWMAEDRVPMAEIASFLGHRDINITIRIYARYHPEYLREAARSLDW